MANIEYKYATLIGCSFCTVSLAIWIGCFLGIYYPFVREFKPARCTMIKSFDMYSASIYNGPPYYSYRQLYMSLSIDSKTYVGFGCESDAQHLPTVVYDSPWGAYAYQYQDCED